MNFCPLSPAKRSACIWLCCVLAMTPLAIRQAAAMSSRTPQHMREMMMNLRFFIR